MVKLILLLVIPYAAISSVALGAVDGRAALDAAREFVGQVQEQSDEIATALIEPPRGLDHRITVCHVPGGDDDQAHLLSIAIEAWPVHEAHGDYGLTEPAVLVEPLASRCAESTEVADEAPGKGAPPEHSNAGGKGQSAHAEDQ